MPTVKFRDAMQNKKYNVGWNPVNSSVSVNNQPFDPNKYGLRNINGSYMGTQNQMDSIFSDYKPATPTASIKTPTKWDTMMNPTPNNAINQGFSWNIPGLNSSGGQIPTKPFVGPPAPIVPTATIKQPDQYAINPELQNKYKAFETASTTPFVYNPDADAGLKQAQNQATQLAMLQGNRRGMMYSRGTKTAMQEAAQNLIPQFQQNAYQQHRDNLGNLQSQLQMLQGIDNTQYNRNRDNIVDSRYTDETQYNRGRTQLGDTNTYQNKFDKIYNPTTQQYEEDPQIAKAKALKASTIPNMNDNYKNLGYVNPYAGQQVPADVRKMLEPYSNDYAGISKQYANSNPQLAQYASMLSAEKMFNNPNLLQQYGQQFMTPDAQDKYAGINKTQVQTTGYQLDNILKQTESELAQATFSPKVEKAYLEIEKLNQDMQKGLIDMEEGVARIDDIRMQTGLRPIQTQIAQQQADTGSRNADTGAYSAETGRINSNLSASKFEYDQTKDTNQSEDKTIKGISDYYEKYFMTQGYDNVYDQSSEGTVLKDGNKYFSDEARNAMADDIQERLQNGAITQAQAKQLMINYSLGGFGGKK